MLKTHSNVILITLCVYSSQSGTGQSFTTLRDLANSPTNAIMGLPFQVTQNNLNATTNRFEEYLPVATIHGNGEWVDEVKVLGAFLDRDANSTIPSPAALEKIHFMVALGEWQLFTPTNLRNSASSLFVGRYACPTNSRVVGRNYYTGINITENAFKPPRVFLDKGRTYGVAVFTVSRDATDPDTLWAVYAVNRTNLPTDFIIMETNVIPMSSIQPQINKLVYTVTTRPEVPAPPARPKLDISSTVDGTVRLHVSNMDIGVSYAVESTVNFSLDAPEWSLQSHLPPSASSVSFPAIPTEDRFFRLRRLNPWRQ